MFFKRKNRDEDLDVQRDFEVVRETVEGTQPEAVEEPDRSMSTGTAVAPISSEATIRLFPGFEREDFEVGFATDVAPALVMRWKDGGSWFTMPAMFNRAVLTAMDEKESANDLTRLLRSYGYDVDTQG
ncbi:MAG: hypothetical protein AAFX52_08160 [Pseudomonadota bacterium]